MREKIIDCIQGSINNLEAILNTKILLSNIETIVELSIEAFEDDKKLLFCGNIILNSFILMW